MAIAEFFRAMDRIDPALALTSVDTMCPLSKDFSDTESQRVLAAAARAVARELVAKQRASTSRS